MATLPSKYAFPLPADFQESDVAEAEMTSPEFDVHGHTFQIKILQWYSTTHEHAAFLRWRRSRQGLGRPRGAFSVSVHSGDDSEPIATRQQDSTDTCNGLFQIGWSGYTFPTEIMGPLGHTPLRFDFTFTTLEPTTCCGDLDTPMRLQCPSSRLEGPSSSFADFPFSDCTVQLRDSTSIPAHRVILCRASPVFSAMWTSGTQESQQQHMKIEAEPAVATALLRFMYGLPAEVAIRHLPELLALADMYNVAALVSMIVDRLAAPGSILDMAAMALCIPALLTLRGSLPEQQQQQVQELVQSAARDADYLGRDQNFLSCWTLSDVQALLGDEATAGAAIKAVRQWVQHDVGQRQQHWAQLLQGVDFAALCTSDVAALSQDAVGEAVKDRIIAELLKRIETGEATATKDKRQRQYY